ncbi:MAG: nucleotidyltransferase domain-containing protein [Nitrospiraceae bacterium]|nr:nucleotidyltransferase domain-containing protein [Nitrospiraceae bacterium]MSR24586.1 nucleotidyltransferase domain-containing protein [Nitrospiraceae bacterium]
MAEIPESVRAILRPYLEQVKKLFGDVIEAVILYGSAAGGEYLPGKSNVNLLVLLAKQDTELLKQYAALHKRWQKEQIVVPLFLTQAELKSSLELFPLEYLEIQDQHVLLAGRDPFPELRIDLKNLSTQCEQELRGNLLRLRQRFVEGGAGTEAITILLPLSFTALMPCLRGLLRAKERPVERSADGVLQGVEKEFGIDTAVFQDVLNLKRGIISPGPAEAPRLFDRYATMLQTLIEKLGRS